MRKENSLNKSDRSIHGRRFLRTTEGLRIYWHMSQRWRIWKQSWMLNTTGSCLKIGIHKKQERSMAMRYSKKRSFINKLRDKCWLSLQCKSYKRKMRRRLLLPLNGGSGSWERWLGLIWRWWQFKCSLRIGETIWERYLGQEKMSSRSYTKRWDRQGKLWD